MLLGCLKRETEQQTRSRELDKQLEAIHNEFQRALKILLLGTGESGKTTIIKQMKILHDNGFNESERLEKVPEIRQNLQESLHALLSHMDRMNIKCSTAHLTSVASCMISHGTSGVGRSFPVHIEDMIELWNDEGVRECFRRSNEFQLIDNAKYFLDKIAIVMHPNYIPTTEDILHSRKISTGIQQIRFSLPIPRKLGGGFHEIRMFDVGGQRDQRSKWIRVFEGIQAILFMMSCGDYDQMLREDPTVNRFAEALRVFGDVWHNRYLCSAGVIVFLNKQDIMEEKIRSGKSIGDLYPEYNSYKLFPKNECVIPYEFQRTRNFIQDKLLSVTNEPPRNVSHLSTNTAQRECYYHFTIATDTQNIRRVFNDVHNMILRENLTSFGLV